jgi:ligand-binding sensor domain-containing protein
MCEDRHGNIWFAVKGSGVYRYDGASFTNFSEKEGLTSHAVHRVVEDSRGRIWCIGWMGAFRYDGESFVNVTRDGPW